MSREHLAEISLEPSDVDLHLADRYQSFSAELLRLSLLGIAAYGYLAKHLLTAKSAPTEFAAQVLQHRWLLVLSLCSLCVSASCALAHRYFSTDVVAHLVYMLRQRKLAVGGNTEAGSRADAERELLRCDLKVSTFLLIASAVSLGIGFISVGVNFALALW